MMVRAKRLKGFPGEGTIIVHCKEAWAMEIMKSYIGGFKFLKGVR